ncbi:cytochrome b5 domain-containing protein 1 [Armigeres subalbatus]|uniref:cytochrome b5 domain-containing protein 1 n=1 Tax=Armigeres subalbatus TaxID=124917 RepID=UPI002ED2CBBB
MPSDSGHCQQQRFYLRDEVVLNNTANRAWVIIHGNVFDITPLFDGNSTGSPKKIHQLLLAFAGKDLSVHFDGAGRPVYRISKDGVRVPEFPPVTIRNAATGKRWWDDKSLSIGRITARERKIRVINNLTFKIQELTVCEEDTITDIQKRLHRFNANANEYTWRSNIDRNDITGDLQIDKTLTENGIMYDNYPPPPMIWIFYQIPPNNSEQINESDGTV